MSRSNLVFLFLLFSVIVIVAGRRDGNQRLKSCCARQKAADKSCKRKFCDFDVLNQDNVLFFLNTCSTKGTTVRDMWDCATSKTDHTDCCKRKNVAPECLSYCSHHTAPTNYLNHLFCVQSFNPIRDCFREHLEQNPNIFGDT